MATTYKLVQRRDMHKGATEGDKLYYAQAKSTGTSDMERLCSMIGERSCVSSADVKAVLDSLIYVMKLEMSDGKIVQLGEFGNFRITFGSEGRRWRRISTPLRFVVLSTPSLRVRRFARKRRYCDSRR